MYVGFLTRNEGIDKPGRVTPPAFRGGEEYSCSGRNKINCTLPGSESRVRWQTPPFARTAAYLGLDRLAPRGDRAAATDLGADGSSAPEVRGEDTGERRGRTERGSGGQVAGEKK
jgi:hypothetical protein